MSVRRCGSIWNKWKVTKRFSFTCGNCEQNFNIHSAKKILQLMVCHIERLLNILWNIRTSHLLPPTKLRRGFINLLTLKICTFYVTWFLHIYIFVVLLMPHEDTNLLSNASFVSYVFVEMFVNWGNKKVFCFAWVVLHTYTAHANVSIKYT